MCCDGQFNNGNGKTLDSFENRKNGREKFGKNFDKNTYFHDKNKYVQNTYLLRRYK